MITTVTPNSTVDVVAPVDSFEKGRVLRTGGMVTYPGGKGTNVARALAVLGARTFATGFCGTNDSHDMSHYLSHYGVDSSFIPVYGYNRFCLLIPETKKGGRETIINSESNIKVTGADIAALTAKLKTLSLKSRFFVFSGSLPLSAPDNLYTACIKSVNKKAVTLLDTSSKYLREGIKASPHILKQNIHELESAFSVKLPTDAKLKTFMRKISAQYGIKLMVTTLNDRGALLLDNNSFFMFPSVKVKKVVSPVGCGDAFSAGLVYGLSKGMSVVESCRLATACAAANLGYMGSCFFNREDVTFNLRKVKSLPY
ncbi:MAG: 1-phosphofructokinase family hexose kinase [Spirochaetia bacterium]|nr:1-phosphofructokinase family hexose kinase [Spirochaetia bacterium]